MVTVDSQAAFDSYLVTVLYFAKLYKSHGFGPEFSKKMKVLSNRRIVKNRMKDTYFYLCRGIRQSAHCLLSV